jgi:transcriptional regulator with XRE-family HTH domain
MSEGKNRPTIAEALRSAILVSGLTQYRIATDTGIPATSIMRFMRGETSLRLDNADLLAEYLGFRLVRDPNATPPEPTPENLARPALIKHNAKRKK